MDQGNKEKEKRKGIISILNGLLLQVKNPNSNWLKKKRGRGEGGRDEDKEEGRRAEIANVKSYMITDAVDIKMTIHLKTDEMNKLFRKIYLAY